MFGLGTQELVIILVIALIIFGAGRLPQVGASLGGAIRDFKKSLEGSDDKPQPHQTKGEGGTLCPKCGTPMEAAWKNCPHCGASKA